MSYFYAVHVRTVLRVTCGPQTVVSCSSTTVASRCVTARVEKESARATLSENLTIRDIAWNLRLIGKNVLSQANTRRDRGGPISRLRGIISGGSGEPRLSVPRLRRVYRLIWAFRIIRSPKRESASLLDHRFSTKSSSTSPVFLRVRIPGMRKRASCDSPPTLHFCGAAPTFRV